MTNDKLHLRHCILYEFQQGTIVKVACRNLVQVFGKDALSLQTCKRWYEQFKGGDFDLNNEPRPNQSSLIGDDVDSEQFHFIPPPKLRQISDRPHKNASKSKDKPKKLCSKCGKILVELYKHECSNKSDIRIHKCGECGKTFTKYGTLWSHVAYNHRQKTPLTCTLCDKSFNSPSVLREHRIVKHDGTLRHRCKICDKAFPTTTKLKRHATIHNKVND